MRQLALLLIPLLFVSADALKDAVDAKDVAAVKAAIAAGANVNEQDEYGEAPLMHTSDPDVARALIVGGAKVDLTNKYGMNALAANAATGNVPMVKVLIESKANVNFVDERGGIMLENAIAGKNVQIIKMMLDAGAKIPPKKKQDIIDEAAMSESDDVRELIGSVVGKKIAAKAPPRPPAEATPVPVSGKVAWDLANPIATKWRADARLFALTALGDFTDGNASQWMVDFYSPSAKQMERVMVINGTATDSQMDSNELSDLITVMTSTIFDTKKLNDIANANGGSAYTSRNAHPSVALIHNPIAGDSWYFNYSDPDTQRIALTIVINANSGKVTLKDGK